MIRRNSVYTFFTNTFIKNTNLWSGQRRMGWIVYNIIEFKLYIIILSF